MEPENTQSEAETQDQFTQLKKVTPLSKYLAMCLFVLLPFLGGWIGYTYAPEKVVEVERYVAKEAVVEKEVEVYSQESDSLSPNESVTDSLSSNIFNSDVKEGEQYGAMVVENVGKFAQVPPDVDIYENMHVVFTGKVTVQGTLETNEIIGCYTIGNLTEESQQKIPIYNSDRSVWFCIDNDEILDEGELHMKDRVEVTILSYDYRKYPTTVANSAYIENIAKIH